MDTHALETRNYILFESERKVEIPTGSDEVHLVEAVTANQELSRLGFTLDAKGIMDLAHNTPEDMKDIINSIGETIDDVTGISDFEDSEPFYPNFPEEVMEKSDFELAVNAILYYAFAQTDDPEMTAIAHEIRDMVTSDPDDRIERTAIPVEQSDLRIVTKAEPDELEHLLYERTQALGMSSNHLEHIKEYANLYPDTWIANLFGEGDNRDVSMSSHETRANIAAIAYHHQDTETAKEMMPNAEDILRFAAVLSADRSIKAKSIGMDANLSIEPKDAIFKLSRPEQATVKSMIEASPDVFTSIWHREDMWGKLMNRLDTRDSRFPRMEKVFDNLRNDNRVDERGVELPVSAGHDLEVLMKEVKSSPAEAGSLIEAFADKHPKVFTRNIERIARELSPGSDSVKGLCSAIERNSSDIPVAQLMKLENHVEKADGWDLRIFTNQKGGIHGEENTAKNIDIRVKAEIMNSMDKVIAQNLTKDPVGKVYIAPELSGVTLPLRNIREASDGAVLTKYSVLEGKEDKNIVAFGIFWKNEGRDRADIDLAVVGYKEGYNAPQRIAWDNLRTDWGVHSGDYVDGVIAPEINGAVEYVFVDKQKCEQEGIRYILPEVHGFNISFDKVESVRFCFMEKQGSLDGIESRGRDEIRENPTAPKFAGEIINPTEVVTSYRLTQPASATIPMLYDLKEETFTWIDKDITVGRIPTSFDEVVKNKAALVLYEAKHNDYPSLGDMAERYTKTNGGEVTKDIKEADVVFSFGNIDREEQGVKDTAEVISSLELDKISSQFSGAVEQKETDEQTSNDVERDETDAEWGEMFFDDDDDDWNPFD